MGRSSKTKNPRPRGRNLERGIVTIPPKGIDWLNDQIEGLGTALHQAINHLSSRADAQAGHRGTVAIPKQREKDSSGRIVPGLLLEGDRVGGMADGVLDDDGVNVAQLRRAFSCERFALHPSGFEGWFNDCINLEQPQAVVTPPSAGGIVHAMWGYTYEITDFLDTIIGDPGISESNQGTYYQLIVPATTTVNRVIFTIPPGIPVSSSGPVGFALYSLNEADNSFPLIVKSAAVQANGLLPGPHSLALESRVTIDPGLYAVAYIGPCFLMICHQTNYLLWEVVNTARGQNRYGTFTINGTYDPAGTENLMPDTIDASNLVAQNPPEVPVTYWYDTEEFG